MSAMIELYYATPADAEREVAFLKKIEAIGGRLDCREEEERSIVLTYEFDIWENAEEAAVELRDSGCHIEGPSTYG